MIDLYFSWLISRSINAWDTIFSILFHLLLAGKTISYVSSFYFLLFPIIFFIIPIKLIKENIKLKLAIAIPIGAPIILAKEIIFPYLLETKHLKSCQILKSRNILTKLFFFFFSLNVSIKIFFNFFDFVYFKFYLITRIWIHISCFIHF